MTTNEAMTTQPRNDTEIVQPRLGPRGWARWGWRQLTSMRTALFLLLLLAIGAVPGSVFPQRSLDAARTADWIAQHETAGPILDRLGFFEVYASPWFAAIYLLLFTSLVGCILPRSAAHWRAMRSQPPRAPRRLERLPVHAELDVGAEPAAVLDAAREVLRSKRFRIHSHDQSSVSAEAGYLKETGNLVFHIAILGIIVGIAIGYLWGWKGDAIVPVGQTFTKARFDTFSPGPWASSQDIAPFTIAVDRLDATFEREVQGRGQFGMPRDFTAHVRVAERPGAAETPTTIEVNKPLELDGATAFLLGNGYAPHITVRDGNGQVLYSEDTPFLAQDNNYRSTGAVKVTAAMPDQLGFVGLFLPTAQLTDDGAQSVFPDLIRPALALTAFRGELMPGGAPQSVYALDTSEMTQLSGPSGNEPLRIWLEPGQTFELPDGLGSITFDSVDRFAGLSVRHDPGQWLTLVSSLLALLGLIVSLTVRRRRVFIRVVAADDERRTVVSIAGLAKNDDDGLTDVVNDIGTLVKERFA